MKYSIRGELNKMSEANAISSINSFSLWRLITSIISFDNEDSSDIFIFEAWVNTKEEKDYIFEDMKIEVDKYGGWVDWHMCTHDERIPKPCIVEDRYPRE
ncbi:hypothetical protein PQE75_gp205 [Bacillus phage vB_BcoS-136]|uniref:Uncharacterized protein n=1 Tax=Bacillus phage vB_BcoS-136 TaxID=2419619 RepID=A0A3G3BVL6_9CAUD|nr:hypothetical protein PQE75_gp205 [Bacillus phage vB_BcoS-136]AYP68274.1 hypothetical protein vBBcoS136_00160 [Bacillus phage vB_BcoS-136]